MLSNFFVSGQRPAQTSFKIFLQTRKMMEGDSSIMTVAAIFKNRLFKNGCCKKNSNIFVTKFKLQVRLSSQYIDIHFLWYEKSQLFRRKSGNEPEVVQCPFKCSNIATGFVCLFVCSLNAHVVLMVNCC